MSETVVIRHTLEDKAGVYRVELADKVEVEEQRFDEETGAPLTRCAGRTCDGSGLTQIEDEDGERLPCPACAKANGPVPVIDKREVLVNGRDVVFAADDKRWFKGKSRRPHAEVIAEQLKEIRKALGQDESQPEPKVKVLSSGVKSL